MKNFWDNFDANQGELPLAVMQLSPGIRNALGAAVVFGAATPFAKRLGEGVSSQILAGLLYLGSGLVLSLTLLLRPSGTREATLQRSDLGPLLLAVVFGGMAGPLLLMVGLRTTPAASASLLLNLEAVFTALGAWLIVKEHADRRIVIAMGVIVAGSSLLSIRPGEGFGLTPGALAIAAACLCWGIDNVATRYEYQLTASYTLLSQPSGAVAKRGTVRVDLTYDSADQPYASIAAQQDAQDRAAEEAARKIQLELAVWMANGAKS